MSIDEITKGGVLLQAKPHYFGWKRPLPGRGALDLLEHTDTSGIVIKPEVDPRGWMPPALDQLELGSCTANADNRAFRCDTITDVRLKSSGPQFATSDCGELSRLFTYYYERWLEGTVQQGDVGAEGHDGYRVAKHGLPRETQWPYDISKYNVQPPPCFPRAYYLRKEVRAVPQSGTEVERVLSNNQLITYGFTVYQSFEEQWAQPGVMPVPNPAEEGVLGGHENLLCGYLRSYPNHYLSLNSWGTPWGIFGGYFLFPKATFLDPSMVSDLRTIVRPLGK